MKKLLLSAFILLALNVAGQEKATLNSKGNYQIEIRKHEGVDPINTGKIFEDSKGKTYTIYQSEKGKFFIVRTSAKTGKEYKQYITLE